MKNPNEVCLNSKIITYKTMTTGKYSFKIKIYNKKHTFLIKGILFILKVIKVEFRVTIL